MNKNYNYERKKLMLPEYGRHIHEMVDYLSIIDDRELRNSQTLAVIAVMGNINPLLRDTADYNHKLWDHLFLMADFDLDVDSPYPIPTAETLAPRPEKMEYPDKDITIRHYGKNIERIIRLLETQQDKEGIDEEIGNVARYMRAKNYEYNQEHPNNDAIINDIKRLSKDGISVDEVAIGNLKSDYKQTLTERTKKSGRQQNRPNQPGRGRRGVASKSNKQYKNRGRKQP